MYRPELLQTFKNEPKHQKQFSKKSKNSPIFGLADQYKALELGTWGTEYHKDLDVLTIRSECDTLVLR